MTDFTQTAVSMSAKRELTEPITDLTAFENIVASLINDETIGLTKKETGSISYTAKITYFNAAGDEAGKISLTAPSKTAYEDGISLLKGTEAAETIGGVGASASEEADKALWNTRISCAIGDDTFNVSLNRDSIVITGYAKAETLEAIDEEGWLHTGDLGIIDKDGDIFIRGRKKTMLLGANGQNVYPEEIEDAISTYTFFDESVVVQRGEKLIALVYVSPETLAQHNLTPETLQQELSIHKRTINSKLPNFAHIADIEVRDQEFEKTPKRSIKRYLYS
jgi:acyl-CoA synthetase (AMP-forming)/AMP-acid ligase II